MGLKEPHVSDATTPVLAESTGTDVPLVEGERPDSNRRPPGPQPGAASLRTEDPSESRGNPPIGVPIMDRSISPPGSGFARCDSDVRENVTSQARSPRVTGLIDEYSADEELP